MVMKWTPDYNRDRRLTVKSSKFLGVFNGHRSFVRLSTYCSIALKRSQPATLAKLFGDFEMRDGSADHEFHSEISILVFS